MPHYSIQPFEKEQKIYRKNPSGYKLKMCFTNEWCKQYIFTTIGPFPNVKNLEIHFKSVGRTLKLLKGIAMSSFGPGAGTPSKGKPDFRTDPNLSLEEKREIAGDNYLEVKYDIETTSKAIEEFVENRKVKSEEELMKWFNELEKPEEK